MHKSATKCNKTIGKWCKNKHGASKIIDTFETYQASDELKGKISQTRRVSRINVVINLAYSQSAPISRVVLASTAEFSLNSHNHLVMSDS
jgi:hypothetical protein